MTHLEEVLLSSILASLSVGVPILLYIAANRREAKRDSEARHSQNVKTMRRILQIGEFHPPHRHTEKQGALTVDGLIVHDGNGHDDE